MGGTGLEEQCFKDPTTRLNEIMGKSGRVVEEYGGCLIKVLDPDSFPWSEVFKRLLAMHHTVWVERRDRELVIISRPPSD